MARIAGTLLLLLGLCATLANAAPDPGDSWRKRLDSELTKAEKAVEILDGQQAAEGGLRKRLVSLNERVRALEIKAGRPARDPEIREFGAHADLLSNWTTVAIGLRGRIRRLRQPAPKPKPKPTPEPATPEPADPEPAAPKPGVDPEPAEAPEGRPSTLRYKIRERYDRFTDATRLILHLPVEPGKIEVTMVVQFPGQGKRELTEHDVAIGWRIAVHTGAARPGGLQTLHVLCAPDARRYSAQGVRQRPEHPTAAWERTEFEIEPRVLAELADSTRVEFRLGSNEFAFSSDALRSIRALADRLGRVREVADPGTPRLGGGLGQPKSSGTGFVVTRDGFIATNHHVVEDAVRVTVLVEGREHVARVVKTDVAYDLAILKIEGRYRPSPVIASNRVRLGATVATLGFPNPTLQGSTHKLAKGEIGGLAGIHDDPTRFQISVPVQPGNSGGPLFDMKGNVVGVIVAKLNDEAARAASGQEAENVNYAVKSTYLLRLMEWIPGLEKGRPEQRTQKRAFEDVVGEVQVSTVRILAY